MVTNPPTIKIENLKDGVIKLQCEQSQKSYSIFVIFALISLVLLSCWFSYLLGIFSIILLLIYGKRKDIVVLETVLLFPNIGIQIQDQEKTKLYFLTEIENFAVNEGFEHCRIVVYLVAILTRKNECLVLFEKTRPDVDSIVQAFHVLDKYLTTSK